MSGFLVPKIKWRLLSSQVRCNWHFKFYGILQRVQQIALIKYLASCCVEMPLGMGCPQDTDRAHPDMRGHSGSRTSRSMRVLEWAPRVRVYAVSAHLVGVFRISRTLCCISRLCTFREYKTRNYRPLNVSNGFWPGFFCFIDVFFHPARERRKSQSQ